MVSEMRTGVIAFVLGLASLVHAHAFRVTLDAPNTLRTGDRTAVELRVWAEADRPVMVTPRAEGDAVEVVRGRLLRPDAVNPSASPLLFRIPIAAHEPGPARIWVEVQSFRCEGDECRPIEAEAQVEVHVSR